MRMASYNDPREYMCKIPQKYQHPIDLSLDSLAIFLCWSCAPSSRSLSLSLPHSLFAAPACRSHPYVLSMCTYFIIVHSWVWCVVIQQANNFFLRSFWEVWMVATYLFHVWLSCCWELNLKLWLDFCIENLKHLTAEGVSVAHRESKLLCVFTEMTSVNVYERKIELRGKSMKTWKVPYIDILI